MAHQVENMFSVKETPWHKLGVIVNEAPTAAEAIKMAGLNWQALTQPIYRKDGEEFKIVTTHKALVRNTDGKQLSVVGTKFEPLQNDKAFEFFNPFIESGLASFETAGSLREGRTIWILARLNKAPIDVGSGDVVNKYLLLSNSHDGTMAIRTGFTPVRVVCANTLALTTQGNDSQLLRIRHTANLHDRLDNVQKIVNAADAKFEATAEQYRALTKKDVDQKSLEKYVEIVFGIKGMNEQRREIAKQNAVRSIQSLFETGRGMDLKAANGTYWGLYNAVTEYLSYDKGRDESSRLNSLWFGASRIQNDIALKTALEMVVA